MTASAQEGSRAAERALTIVWHHGNPAIPGKAAKSRLHLTWFAIRD
jgi:hypothetical protein